MKTKNKMYIVEYAQRVSANNDDFRVVEGSRVLSVSQVRTLLASMKEVLKTEGVNHKTCIVYEDGTVRAAGCKTIYRHTDNKKSDYYVDENHNLQKDVN